VPSVFIVLPGGYFTMRGRFVSAGFCSAAGEITSVAHTFQPSGNTAWNSPNVVATPIQVLKDISSSD
jgi:hypothetical protein